MRTTREGSPAADAALLLVALMWGGSYLAAQVMTHVAGPATVLALRFIPSVLVLLVVALVRRAVPDRRVWMVGAVLGGLQAVTLSLEMAAVTRTSATNAGVLVCLAVVIAPALEGAAGGARLPWRGRPAAHACPAPTTWPRRSVSSGWPCCSAPKGSAGPIWVTCWCSSPP